MNESVLEARNRWTIAAVGGCGLLLVLLVLLRLSAPTVPLAGPRSSHPKATVQMARPDDADLLLKAETELRDLRPLFLPTDRNAALPEPRIEPGRTFHDNEMPKLTFTEAEAQVSRNLPPVVMLNGQPVAKATPADALSPNKSELALQGFGRADPRVAVFSPRGGYVEVTALETGSRVLGETLPVTARPPVDKAWAPVEYIAAVDAAGLVSPLVVTVGSRVDEVDAHFRDYLAQTFRIGERLSSGFYRISVAP
jgi:hypothetical protein